MSIDRFRGNLIVAGGHAFQEDHFGHVTIGGLVFQSQGPCTRCQMICVDQQTAMRSQEPLKTLATFRRIKVTIVTLSFPEALQRMCSCVTFIGQSSLWLAPEARTVGFESSIYHTHPHIVKSNARSASLSVRSFSLCCCVVVVGEMFGRTALEGILSVYKPAGITSFDVVHRIRAILNGKLTPW